MVIYNKLVHVCVPENELMLKKVQFHVEEGKAYTYLTTTNNCHSLVARNNHRVNFIFCVDFLIPYETIIILYF